MIFQGRGRPQGNGDKTDLRLFPEPALISREQGKTTRTVAIEMAMDFCIDEKDEERESKAQSVTFFGYPLRHPLVLLGDL